MTTHTERQRLAAMGNALRPDWPVRSLLTFLERDHAHRAYTDLAVALACLATDPATKTPARLSEPGPWWTATSPGDTTPTIGPGKEPRCPDHEHELARNCRCCRADAIGRIPNPLRDQPRPQPPAERRQMPRVPERTPTS